VKTLTGTQRKYLRGLAHPLNPVVHVGRGGLTDSVLAAVGRALDDHELIKVKIALDRDERAEIAGRIAEGCAAELAGTVGTIAILYKEHRDPARRQIALPRGSTPPDPE
jgi:RNA-binding protein